MSGFGIWIAGFGALLAAFLIALTFVILQPAAANNDVKAIKTQIVQLS